jgi:hypothetical protein
MLSVGAQGVRLTIGGAARHCRQPDECRLPSAQDVTNICPPSHRTCGTEFGLYLSWAYLCLKYQPIWYFKHWSAWGPGQVQPSHMSGTRLGDYRPV